MSILTRFRVRCNMLLQMSKSPVEKPAATHRGAEQPPTPRLAEKLEVKMMACGDDTLETSPVEQQFVQRKQKYSSPLCQGKHLSQVFSEIIACDCQWRVQLSSLFTLAHPGFPRSFSERGRISKSLKWSKNSAAPSTPKLRESTAQPPPSSFSSTTIIYLSSLFFFFCSYTIHLNFGCFLFRNGMQDGRAGQPGTHLHSSRGVTLFQQERRLQNFERPPIGSTESAEGKRNKICNGWPLIPSPSWEADWHGSELEEGQRKLRTPLSEIKEGEKRWWVSSLIARH